MSENEEFKILLYKFLDSIEYEYNRRFNVAYNNYLIHCHTDDEDTDLSLLKLHKAQSQKECIEQISLDIRKIIQHN